MKRYPTGMNLAMRLTVKRYTFAFCWVPLCKDHILTGNCQQHGQNSSELEEVDDYVDTRGAEEVEFSNDEEEEEDAIQLVQVRTLLLCVIRG